MGHLWLLFGIQVIASQAIHMLCEIGDQLSDSLRVKLIALLVEVVEDARQFRAMLN